MIKEASSVSSVRKIVAANLNRFMEEQHISRRKLSEELDIKYTTLCDWVKGNSTPKPEAVERLSAFLGVEVADFYVDHEEAADQFERLMRYSGNDMVLEMDVAKSLTEDQIRALLKKGFTFRRLTLEEYIERSGKPLRVSREIDWGEPVGRELW